jgi:hypothetical protein
MPAFAGRTRLNRDHDNSRRQLMTKLATMARSDLPRAGSGFAADRGPPSACGTGLHFVLSMRAIVNVGLQHRSFTLLSPNGPSSEKASDLDFDCAWGEKTRIGTEEVGPPQRCRPGRGAGRVSVRADESGVSSFSTPLHRNYLGGRRFSALRRPNSPSRGPACADEFPPHARTLSASPTVSDGTEMV